MAGYGYGYSSENYPSPFSGECGIQLRGQMNYLLPAQNVLKVTWHDHICDGLAETPHEVRLPGLEQQGQNWLQLLLAAQNTLE